MHPLFRSTLIALGGLLITASTAAHAQNLLTNGSFEMGSFVNNGQGAMSLAPGSTNITGWTTYNAELAWLTQPNVFPGVTASEGLFSLDFSGYHDSTPYSGVQQTLPTVQNASYLLSFDLGGLTNSNLNYSLTASAGSASQTFTYHPFLGGSDYGRFTLGFTATGSSTVISLLGTSSGTGNYIGLDNVSVIRASAVPEPGSVAILMGISMFGGSLLLRRRHKGHRSI